MLRCYLPLLVVLPATIQSQSSSSQGSSDPKQQKGQSEQNWEGTRMGGEVMGEKMYKKWDTAVEIEKKRKESINL